MLSQKLKRLVCTVQILFCVVLSQGRVQAQVQELITEEALNEWFYSRLLLALAVGAVAGFAISKFHLCNLTYAYTGALNINSRARRKLMMWIGVFSCVGALLLFIDAWVMFPFGPAGLRVGEVFTQVWTNYRMLLVLLTMNLAILLVVALATRLSPRCRCRYAFIGGPRAKKASTDQ
jgi:hypothetical protein